MRAAQESVDRGGHSVWLIDVWDVTRILDNGELRTAHPFGEVATDVRRRRTGDQDW
jgi:hypothetical protein